MRKALKIAVQILAGIALVAIFSAFSGKSHSSVSPLDTVIFPHDKVIEVYIQIDEAELQKMFDQARQEQYVMCNVVYNGYMIKNVGIRPKGNSSLMHVASSSSNRYSFKLDFNEFVKGQSLFGITKINLNNGFSDPSFMREYLTYEISQELGLQTPKTTYVALYINDSYFGLYLGVENVDVNFVRDRFTDGLGDLYKPEGKGANLVYIDDNPQSYSGLALQTNKETSDKSSAVEMLRILSEGSYEELEEILDTDSFLKYYALCVATGNMDSILGGMYHNYYLYEDGGKFVIIPWDFNMAFGGFPGFGGNSAGSLYIDYPALNMDSLPIVNRLLTNEEYLEKYRLYLGVIVNGYLSDELFGKRIREIASMIDSYVRDDPNSFYSYAQYLASLNTYEGASSLYAYNSIRVQTITKQLSGELPSRSDGSEGTDAAFGRVMPVAGNLPRNVQGVPQFPGERNPVNFDSPEREALASPQIQDRSQGQAQQERPFQDFGAMDFAADREERMRNLLPQENLTGLEPGGRVRNDIRPEDGPESKELSQGDIVTILASMISLGLSIALLNLKRRI